MMYELLVFAGVYEGGQLREQAELADGDKICWSEM